MSDFITALNTNPFCLGSKKDDNLLSTPNFCAVFYIYS